MLVPWTGASQAGGSEGVSSPPQPRSAKASATYLIYEG
jgi:hypothetical protein